MAEPFLSEIRIMSFGFPPKGWALCDGQLLPINQNQALFSLLGTTYGGDGRVNFGLPNLQGRTPIHVGSGHTWASVAESKHIRCRSARSPRTFIQSMQRPQLQRLTHRQVMCCWASHREPVFMQLPLIYSAMDPSEITNIGGSQAHLNMQPFLMLNFSIALQGIFPSQT